MQRKLIMLFVSTSSCWRRAPPFLCRRIQCVYTGCINREPPWDKKSHSDFLHLPDTTHSLPLPNTTHIPHSRHQTPSHVGLSVRFKHAANIDEHVCSAAGSFDCPTQTLRSSYVEQHMWVFITSVLIRATPRTLWDVAALQNKQACRHGWNVIGNICMITQFKNTKTGGH